MIYEKCPICNNELEGITNEDVIDWYCSQCGINWSLEDLGYKEIQENLGKWLEC